MQEHKKYSCASVKIKIEIMKTVEVYHARKPNFGFGDPIPFDEYELVAEFKNDKSIEDVFMESQNLGIAWTSKVDGIYAIHKKECRSTSVGDIIKKDDVYHLCENMGWTEIDINTYGK